ncbi:MLXIP isoform 9 [Pan troglodytes]|uniref:MLX interacting protein n=2 Tax=Pan troglodytes TaxID=9598 RepID=A0A2I3T6V9_PANTR|nr:MLXIP isoform 9 [Pan troglodytes]
MDGQGCEHTSRTEDPFIQPTDFGPSEPPLSVPPPISPVLPLVPPPATALNPPAPPTFHQPQKVAGVNKAPSVITHTASATLTHDAPATTFSQSQGLVITTHHPAPSAAPCGLALSPVTQPPQPRLTFVHPKPVSLTGGRPKQPHKIVPAPKPEPVSLVLKNARIAPGEPGGETQCGAPPDPEGCFPIPKAFKLVTTTTTLVCTCMRTHIHLNETKVS